FPYNLATMATIAAQGAVIVGNIMAVAGNFEGGGYTGNAPRTGGMDGRGGFLVMMHPRERVIDLTQDDDIGGRTTIQIHQTFTGGVTQADLLRASEKTKHETMEAVADGISRGGSFRKAVQR